MIAILKSTKSVLVNAIEGVNAKPQCKLLTFTEYKDGFSANGKYFYEDEDEKQVEIKVFNKEFSHEEADQLFASLNIEFPANATFSGMRSIEKAAALKAVVASEERFGLTINDYE